MNTDVFGDNAPAPNSRFKKWRKMCKIHIFLSQEFLSLTENNQLRSSPLHEAAERYRQPFRNCDQASIL